MFTFQDNDSSDPCDFDTRRYSFDKKLEPASINQSLNDPIILRATETTASSNFPMSTNAVDYNHMSINDFQEDQNTLNYPSDKTSKDTQIEDHKNVSLENIPSIQFKELTEVLISNSFLEYLNISNCKLSDLQITTVATALSKTSTLRQLYFTCNEIVTDNTAHKVASVVINNLSLM